MGNFLLVLSNFLLILSKLLLDFFHVENVLPLKTTALKVGTLNALLRMKFRKVVVTVCFTVESQEGTVLTVLTFHASLDRSK